MARSSAPRWRRRAGPTSPCWPGRTISSFRSTGPSPTPACRCDASGSPGEPLAAAIRAAGMLSSAAQLRGWAHDTLEGTPTPYGAVDEASVAQRGLPPPCSSSSATGPTEWRGAAHLARRHQPVHRRHRGGRRRAADLPRSQGSRVADRRRGGCRDGLIPHSTAGSAEHTRRRSPALVRRDHPGRRPSADHPVLRRGGYARALSPFVVGLDVSSPTPVAPPADVRVALATPGRASSPVAGRGSTPGALGARAADLLTDQSAPTTCWRGLPEPRRRRHRTVVVDRARAADGAARVFRR